MALTEQGFDTLELMHILVGETIIGVMLIGPGLIALIAESGREFTVSSTGVIQIRPQHGRPKYG